jgi:beta-glucosidase
LRRSGKLSSCPAGGEGRQVAEGSGSASNRERYRALHPILLWRIVGPGRDGIDVRTYTYWSALDNFEWNLGYRPTFGGIAVDRTPLERSPKPSARWLGAVARAGGY